MGSRRPHSAPFRILARSTLATILACGSEPAPTGPGPGHADLAVALSVSPTSMDFTSPSATPLTLTTDANGRAVFTDLTLTGQPGHFPLYFTAVGYTEVASAPVTVAAPPAGP